jgi:ABC-type phosphonate transport system ATPase subunit
MSRKTDLFAVVGVVGGMKTTIFDAIMAAMCVVGVSRCENERERCKDVFEAAADERRRSRVALHDRAVERGHG